MLVQPLALVVPTKTDYLLYRLLNSLWQTHTSLDGFEIHIIDDGLRERPFADHSTVHYIAGAKPFCYARNVNLGIRAATLDTDIVLLNDDTFFATENALLKLAKAAHTYPNVGIVSPVFNRFERNPRQRWGCLDPMSGLWLESQMPVTFAAAYLRRDVLQGVGLLDERFTGYGYEDNDYCLRAWRAGYKTGILPSVIIMHGDSSGRASMSFRSQDHFAELFRENRRRFVAKWAQALLVIDERASGVLNDLLDGNLG